MCLCVHKNLLCFSHINFVFFPYWMWITITRLLAWFPRDESKTFTSFTQSESLNIWDDNVNHTEGKKEPEPEVYYKHKFSNLFCAVWGWRSCGWKEAFYRIEFSFVWQCVDVYARNFRTDSLPLANGIDKFY